MGAGSWNRSRTIFFFYVFGIEVHEGGVLWFREGADGRVRIGCKCSAIRAREARLAEPLTISISSRRLDLPSRTPEMLAL